MRECNLKKERSQRQRPILTDREVFTYQDGYFNLIRAMVEQSQNDILTMPIVNKKGRMIDINVRYLNDSIRFLKRMGTPDKVIDDLWRHRFDGTEIQYD